MTAGPWEDSREWQLADVIRVDPDWYVDVRLLHASSAVQRRVKVVGEYLPEVHTAERQSRVLVGRVAGWQQGPVCIPIHHTIANDEARNGYVYWSEHLRFRITIKDGELEIRNANGDALLRIRLLEDGQVLRLDVPSCRVVLNGASGELEVYGQGTVMVKSDSEVHVEAPIVAVEATNAEITADTVTVQGNGAVTISAPVVAINPP